MDLNMETLAGTPDIIKNMPSGEPHESTHITQSMSPSNIATELDLLDSENSTSIYKTFQTTELCEGILSHLSLFELWRARSVCKSFQKIIDHSPLLRRNSFLKSRARNPSETTSYQAYLDQHEVHPLLESSFVRVLFNPCTTFEIRYLDQEKPKLMRVFHKKEKLDNLPPTFTFSNAMGTGFADDSPLLDMYICNPPAEAVQLKTKVTFWNPTTLLVQCRHFQSFAVIRLKGVTFGQIFERAMSEAPWQHEGTGTNDFWQMEVRVNSFWGAVGPDHGSHVELANDVGCFGELIWNYRSRRASCGLA
jgi:hypothetical protein